jgi:hypothetical protein
MLTLRNIKHIQGYVLDLKDGDDLRIVKKSVDILKKHFLF